jgi:Bacterial sugar transferase
VVGSSVVLDDVWGMPRLGIPRFGLARSSAGLKRSFDLLGATRGLLLCFPLLAAILALIKLNSPGPALFRQLRIGRDARRSRSSRSARCKVEPVRRGLFVIVPTVVVGVVAALVTIAAHQGDTAFVFEQQHPTRIEPGQLESIVKRTREPLPAGSGSAAISARCVPGHSGPKLNPWRCTIRYASGDAIRYRIVVQLSGRFQGVDRTRTRVIDGCCLPGGAVPSG